jgi:DNA-binding NtrC family response regulator
VESELFGHARGAFTGAGVARAGRFEHAHGGTIFLDEVGTMPESAQLRLLRVLQERKVQRVGDSTERAVDARVVAATNADLEGEVAAGRFRADLFYRLDVIPVAVPPLRERIDDLPELAEHLLERACARLGRPVRRLSPRAVRRLQQHRWPGNVRELENALEAAVIRCGGREIVEPQDLPLQEAGASSVTLPAEGVDLDADLAAEERAWMKLALQKAGGQQSEAARLLNVSRTTFARKAKHYGLA